MATTNWAYKYIEYGRARGIIGGYAEGDFRPRQPVTRGQTAVFLAKIVAGSDAAIPPGKRGLVHRRGAGHQS